MRIFCSLITGAILVMPAAARAEVTDATPAGFSIKVRTELSAGAAAVFRALADPTRMWWDSTHTFSGSAANLSIDARAGGCFCEQLPNGSVQHLTVTYVDRPKQLRMSGALGPLGPMAVSGSMTWQITEASGRSQLELTYTVGGYSPQGLNALAAPVDGVLATQVQRLKRYVETGRPE